MPVQVTQGQGGVGFVHNPIEVQVRSTDAGNNPRANEAVQIQLVRAAATIDPAAGGPTNAQGEFTFRITPTVAAPGMVRVTIAGEQAEVHFTGEVAAHDAAARSEARAAREDAESARWWVIAALVLLGVALVALVVFSNRKFDTIAGKIDGVSSGLSELGKKIDEAVSAAKGAEKAAMGAKDAVWSLHRKIGEVPPVPFVGSKDCFEDPEQEVCKKAAAAAAKE